ncbi:MAG: FadD7 family fatty acid--CoA ligase [Actinomycetia bacterium]|nr:FadD7 family fatty acid--CoA ligase [Actinomycetes bacterium]MCH9702688.1 FadD7 family fatty acid--CoA ligase [Actinomycetes bacterium]MCH9760721.1 FadD7 family fatty acid--CoA ligase [Actinomycetes bacterium]
MVTPKSTAAKGVSLGDLAEHVARTHAAKVALSAAATGTRITYEVLADLVSRTATSLSRSGLRSGDVVGLRTANNIGYVVGLLGAARAELVTVPLDPALPREEQQIRLKRVGARAVLTDRPATAEEACPDMLIEFSASAPTGPRCDVRGKPAAVVDPPPVGLSPSDAMVMFTSGTTAMPKMVPWTHDGLNAAMANVATAYELGPADSTVAVMPLFHGHGLVAGLLATLSTAGRLGLPTLGRFSAKHFFDELNSVGATWFTAVPTIHQILLNTAPPSAAADAQVRFLRSCSAPLPPEVARRLEAAFDALVLPAYGMTEATHQACAVTASADLETRLRTVGEPTGAELRITDESGGACPVGVRGEVWLRGPAVTRGYLNDARATAETFVDGWLRTGDLGSMDPAGVLTLDGRIKNIINRGGEKISPEHVEDTLLAHPDVTEAAVFGMPDAKYGEQVVAAVILRAGASLDDDALEGFCASRLSRYEVPARILRVGELPVTAKGSVDRNRLVRAFGTAGQRRRN